MSVVGLDVGNETGVVGVARQRGIDVVLNEESKRETPAMVSFSDKQRFLGTAAAASSTMNPQNTISQVKRLIGRKFRDSEVQRDLRQFPFSVTEGPDGSPIINVQYLGEVRSFTPTQILGMILSNLKSIAEKNLGTHVVDCVIGIPVFFTELQRRAYLDAASIAGLHPLRLMHETAATALAYGIYKTDLPETDPIHVVFVDVGHASMQVCVAAFKKGQLKILSQAFDRSLGGRDFDEVLFNHFAAKFKDEYKIDVPSNARASQRLRAACEKVKKVLSANAVAPLSIECLMDEKDVKGFIKREEFEKLAEPLLERVKVPIEKALAESRLTIDRIHSVEVVGSGSRVPAIIRILASFFKKEPGRTLNASECIARGCALQCAMLSPTFRVREFEVQDAYPFPIALSWKGSAPEHEDVADQSYPNSLVFVKGNPIPSTKMLTFYRSGMFTIDVLYADMSELPPETSPKISSYTVGPFTPKSERGKLKVKIRLNLHGIVSVESATLIEEEEVEVSVTKVKETRQDGSEVSPMETDKQENGAEKVDAFDKDVKMDTDNPQTVDQSSVTENGLPADEKSQKGESKEAGKKKKPKRKEVPVHENVLGALPQTELQKAVEKEYEFALQDRVMEETKDRKNAVEAYVYDMRNKLYEKLQDYVTDTEREELSAKLQQTEDWLYEEGEDEIKSVYIAKLEELKKLGDPIEERQREEEARGPAIAELHYYTSSFREAALSSDPKFDHIEVGDREKVVLECNKAEEWLRDKKQQQDSLPKTTKPALLSMDIRKKTEVLDRFCKPILTKPKPSPPKASPPQAAESKGNEKKDNKNGSQPSGAEVPTSEPMDSDNLPPQEGERMHTE
ncbi:hypothetical protein O6H91_01G015000 [Diphasiastrum complanatum]|uniref:Uncharacterized protein n=1 Tax=Diphasiastrum complanatum TaxID=34168 RepID=A0ACC2ENA2_DIPCM|nr:hypothetical protein O6H91_01G015000 [Diphasiastrum complanatum]